MSKKSAQFSLLVFAACPAFSCAGVPSDALRIVSAPVLATCPIGSCPPISSPQAAYSALEQYTVSQKVKNWEIGAAFGMLDATGAHVGQANDHTDGAKMGVYIGLMQTANGGPGWSLNSNIVRNAQPGGVNSVPGYAGAGTEGRPGAMDVYSSTIGYELDLSNFDRDSNGLPPRYPFVVGEYLTTTSTYTSWAGIFYGIGDGQKADSWHDGILFSSPNQGGGRSVSDNTILDLSNADVGYHSLGIHANAGWYDESRGKYGLWLTGTKMIEDIDISSSSPVALAINGQRPSGAIHMNISALGTDGSYGILDTSEHGKRSSYDDRSNGDAAIEARGHYTQAAFSSIGATTAVALNAASGQKVCFDHGNHCLVYKNGALNYLVSDRNIMKIDDNGNITIQGTITQNGKI
ncbi:hypothetical protein [Gluconobacter oxydans]|uniref:hypothetical protein n=1 Tax=Gluconobacter oxydans TaxID=442 RepID=UPI0039E8D9C2